MLFCGAAKYGDGISNSENPTYPGFVWYAPKFWDNHFRALKDLNAELIMLILDFSNSDRFFTSLLDSPRITRFGSRPWSLLQTQTTLLQSKPWFLNFTICYIISKNNTKALKIFQTTDLLRTISPE
jgi:hypothetical protein